MLRRMSQQHMKYRFPYMEGARRPRP